MIMFQVVMIMFQVQCFSLLHYAAWHLGVYFATHPSQLDWSVSLSAR